MAKYDYLVVGAGLYGAVFTQQARAAGKSVLPTFPQEQYHRRWRA